jgi:hypothetical protein
MNGGDLPISYTAGGPAPTNNAQNTGGTWGKTTAINGLPTGQYLVYGAVKMTDGKTPQFVYSQIAVVNVQ